VPGRIRRWLPEFGLPFSRRTRWRCGRFMLEAGHLTQFNRASIWARTHALLPARDPARLRNMSSATLMFVLAKILGDSDARGPEWRWLSAPV
jgi:hypothetical protein